MCPVRNWWNSQGRIALGNVPYIRKDMRIGIDICLKADGYRFDLLNFDFDHIISAGKTQSIPSPVHR